MFRIIPYGSEEGELSNSWDDIVSRKDLHGSKYSQSMSKPELTKSLRQQQRVLTFFVEGGVLETDRRYRPQRTTIITYTKHIRRRNEQNTLV